MNERERRAFNREVYGPDLAPHQRPAERAARSSRSADARKLATELKLPQRIVDRAASYAADMERFETVETAVEAAIVADHEYAPTLPQALAHADKVWEEISPE